MRELKVTALAKDWNAQTIFPILCDFKMYQKHSDVVKDITIINSENGRSISNWEVTFRNGILKWQEEDRFIPESHTIEFMQIEGDAEHFSGKWQAVDTPEGCEIEFSAQFDMGIPSLSEIIDPIAEQALKENIESIIKGILNGQVQFI